MKHIKRYFSFAIVFVFVLFGLFSINVNAESEPLNDSNLLEITGVSVRTTGKAGIRFKISIDGYNLYNYSVLEYGVVIGYGENASAHSLQVDGSVNSKSVISGYSTTLDEVSTNSYYVTLYNIPATDYDTYVTARAYLKVQMGSIYNNTGITYGTKCVSINLAEVAAKAYNESNTYNQAGNLVYDVATSLPIQVNFKGDSKTYYHDDFSTDFHNQINNKATTLETIVTLGDAEYSKDLTITNNYITFIGYSKKETSFDRSYLLDYSYLSGTVKIAGDDINLESLAFGKTLVLFESQSNININKCHFNCDVTAIKDEFSSGYTASQFTHSTIVVTNSSMYAYRTSTEENICFVNLNSYLNGFTFRNNGVYHKSAEDKADDLIVKSVLVSPGSSFTLTLCERFVISGKTSYAVWVGSCGSDATSTASLCVRENYLHVNSAVKFDKQDDFTTTIMSNNDPM